MKIVQILETMVIIALLVLEILHDFKLVPFNMGINVVSLICAGSLLILCIILAAKRNQAGEAYVWRVCL